MSQLDLEDAASNSAADINETALKKTDDDNRKLALNLTSFIVEAPAGAGKTELLTQRYLRLLAVVDEPEEIVALTFSNKATAEMRNRILLSLENAQNLSAEFIANLAPHQLITRGLATTALNRASIKGWNLLNQPARLRIMTIDALCSSLARQMPLLSRFGGQPAVSDNAEAHYIEAARRCMAGILNETAFDDVVTTALRYMDNDAEKLGQLLANMLAKRDQWLPLVGRHTQLESDEISQHIEAALNYLIEQDLQQVAAVITPKLQNMLMPLAHFSSSNLAGSHPINLLSDWDFNLAANVEDLPLWLALAQLLLTKDGNLRKRMTVAEGFPPGDGKAEKDQFKLLKEAFLELMASYPELETLAAIRKLPDTADMPDNNATILAISKLLQLATAHLWGVFQAANEVDFVQVAASASLALGDIESNQGVTDLALKLDYRISHLLIDEFQDTSPVQMSLITQLIQGWETDFFNTSNGNGSVENNNDNSGDGRTLFCVGDPMQSIYRFRKADVSLFLQASTLGIGHLKLTPLRLSLNNRSHPAVITWINQAFNAVFPKVDSTATGAISYRPFIAKLASVADEGVEIHPVVFNAETESAGAKIVEARVVAALIARERANNKDVKIAVLVRSRSHLRELVSEIRRNYADIKFQAVEIEELSNRQSVQDALSLTHALLQRADRVHWLSILRAPWCGLALHDLHTLCADDQQATLWQLMQNDVRCKKLSDDGQIRLAHVKAIMTEAFANQGRMPLRRWLESTWLKLGGAACMVDAGDIRDIQAYFDLVDLQSQVGQLDFTQLESAMQKLYAKPDATAPDDLQFLTIHKSKGLEFDTVILPALNRTTRGNDPALLLWEEVLINGQIQLIAAPFVTKKKEAAPSVYHYLQDLENTRNVNESARLLYVAATRTVRKLHLIATVKPSKEGNVTPIKKSFLDLLWPQLGGEFLRAAEKAGISAPAGLLENVSGGLQEQTTSTRLNDGLNSEANQETSTELELADFIPQLVRLQHPTIPSLLTNHQLTSLENYQGNNSFKLDIADQDEAVLASNLAMDCGTLAHLYMELIAKSGASTWDGTRLNKLQPAMAQWLMQKGHTLTIAQHSTQYIVDALQTTLKSGDGQWVLSTHNQAVSELSLMQMEQDELNEILSEATRLAYKNQHKNQHKNHRIDRTFIVEGTRWIIDYKLTQSQITDDLNQLAESHRPQLTRYASLFSHEAQPIQVAVLFLSIGKLVKL